MADTCGVVLAAGAARRFGSAKQLADLAGRPLLQWAVDAANASPDLDEVVVVLGAREAEVRAALVPGRARLVSCADWEEGMAASLRCGMRACVERGAAWGVVLLGDEPRLPPAVVRDVVAATRSAAPAVQAVRATWEGRPGHPVALRTGLAARVEALRGDAGARALLDDVVVLEVECGPSPGDVDTPADLDRLRD